MPFPRATVTLPPDLLKGTDRLARRSGTSRSALVADALRAYLAARATGRAIVAESKPAGLPHDQAALLSRIESRTLVDEIGRRLGAVAPATTDRPVMGPRLRADPVRLAELCRAHHIRKLSLFGSVLTEGFGPQSDVDLLVEFEPGYTPGLRIADIEDEFTALFGGRRVDLVTERSLHPLIRDRVLASAVMQYAA